MPMDTTKPSRKKIRLDGYDYSSSGAYFITICTMDRKPLLWKRSDADFGLSHCGETVKTAIESIEKHYKYVAVDKYCIMPNHVHILIQIREERSPQSFRFDIPNIVGKYKASVTRKVGKELLFHEKLWQSSFFDHIIRNQEDYARIWDYISGNPSRWLEDRLYIE